MLVIVKRIFYQNEISIRYLIMKMVSISITYGKKPELFFTSPSLGAHQFKFNLLFPEYIIIFY